MKIDAVDVVLFAWDDIPPTRYTAGAQNCGGQSNLGLVTIRTDAGVDGHAFWAPPPTRQRPTPGR
jgi:hypothetical protein